MACSLRLILTRDQRHQGREAVGGDRLVISNGLSITVSRSSIGPRNHRLPHFAWLFSPSAFRTPLTLLVR